MIVRFLLNLGTVDAKRLGLDHLACAEGRQADVSEPVGLELVRRGFAEPVAKPKPIRAVPEAPAIAERKTTAAPIHSDHNPRLPSRTGEAAKPKE